MYSEIRSLSFVRIYIGTLQYSQYPHTEPLAYSTFSGSAFSFSSLDSVALAIVIKMHKPRNNNCPICILIISAPLLVNSKTAAHLQRPKSKVLLCDVFPVLPFPGIGFPGLKTKLHRVRFTFIFKVQRIFIIIQDML